MLAAALTPEQFERIMGAIDQLENTAKEAHCSLVVDATVSLRHRVIALHYRTPESGAAGHQAFSLLQRLLGS